MGYLRGQRHDLSSNVFCLFHQEFQLVVCFTKIGLLLVQSEIQRLESKLENWKEWPGSQLFIKQIFLTN